MMVCQLLSQCRMVLAFCGCGEYQSSCRQGCPSGAEITPFGPDPVCTGVGRRTLLQRTSTRRLEDSAMTQIEAARRGTVTPEMEFVAKREELDEELIRDE